MKIFYVKIDEFRKEHDKDFLTPYTDKNFGSEKRFYEYAIGRYIVKKISKEIFNIKDTEIVINKEGKPEFKNEDLHFSISHSNNIVLVCFDKSPCGVDVEQIKKRDLTKLSKHYNENFETLEEFYKFWTTKEAIYKLHAEAKSLYSSKFENEYYIAAASSEKNILIHKTRLF